MNSKHLFFTCVLLSQPLLCQTSPIEEDIPFTEDLMKEHGILNRTLLIYEKAIALGKTKKMPIKELNKAVDIMQSFIHDYHEKLEETYVFPLFEKSNNKIELVKTLRLQHDKGRDVTRELKKIISLDRSLTKREKKRATSLMRKFIIMYRPHEARENTELFPMVRSLISPKDFEQLGEKFESSEHELFGPHGFEDILKKIENIEKELGIYQLAQFTPHT